MKVEAANNRLESDGLPFRCAPGQAAAQAERLGVSMSSRDWNIFMRDTSPADMVELLASGLDVNAQNSLGDYLITLACQCLCTEIVRLLIDSQANINCQNSNGDTPLICAIDYAHHDPESAYEIARILLDRGADIELRGYMDKTPFLKACSRGCLDILKLLVSRGCNINAICDDGNLGGREFAEIFEAPLEFRRYLCDLYENA